MKAHNFQDFFRLVFLLVLIFCQHISFGQDAILKTQADVDAFDPATTEVMGDLQIGEIGTLTSDITDLSNLSNITTVGGWLNIRSTTDLTDVDDLSNLTSVGEFVVVGGNESLVNIDGLSNLTSVATDIIISENDNLISINGLSGLSLINKSLVIRFNASLIDLAGLNNVTSISNNVEIRGNNQLANLEGLDNLESVGRYLTIEENENLVDVSGLSNLTTIGQYLIIKDNNALTDITGLNSLTTLGGFMQIINNDNLPSIDGLNTLSSIGSSISIEDNDNIISIGGLSNINEIINDLSIMNNTNLLNVDGFGSLLSVGRRVTIENNDKLETVNGLSNLTTIGDILRINRSDGLLNLDGFSNLVTIGGDLQITNCDNLTNIDGLSKLISVGDFLHIRANNNLTNVDGLSSLTSVEGRLYIEINDNLMNVDGLSSLTTVGGNLHILSNDGLINIDGFQNLTLIEGELLISSNEILENVDGFRNLTTVGEDFSVRNNTKLVDCCGIQNIIENKATAIGGVVEIAGNPSECNTEQQVLTSDCGISIKLSTTPACIGTENGIIQVYVENYEITPFQYEWMRQEDGLTGSGVSESDEFIIDMLGTGTYNLTVTNATPDIAIKNDIALSELDGSIFEITKLTTTNSSNGLDNGSITLTTSGGTGPYRYSWSGVASGMQSDIADNFYTIPFLGYGEYLITVEDAAGASKIVEVSLLDEEVPVVECEAPLDIVILNDVSGSVDATEYKESKQFFVDFLKEANIGSGIDESRASIVEWSSSNEQKLKIPITGEISTLQSYTEESRAFNGGTSPHQAIEFGRDYLDANARPDVEKVLILSTDGSSGQISSSLIALADELKANGYHIISVAFDGAYSNNTTRNILRQIASVDALAPGAPAYSQLDVDLAKVIVHNYLCPIDPGSSATAYFNRDGAIDIIEIEPAGNCPFPDFVEVTIDISAFRELSIPGGTPVTFYHNNPNQSGATKILTWQIPCAIPVGTTDTYTITLPMDGPSNIFAVLNDDGVQGAPINFPITSTEEIAYTNNIDSERICLDEEATIQAFKYSTLPIPACDTLVNYTINVCNISEVDAFGVTVEDIPPAGFVLTGTVFNDNGCATDLGASYDLPADCCFSLNLTYDAGPAAHDYYGDQDVILGGPSNQTYIDFDGSTTTEEDVTLDGSIDCPSSNITFTKTVNVDESCDDSFVEFTFTITNEMNIPLKGLTFRDVLPDPCTWAYLPYGESGLSIANPNIMGKEAVFIIDEVQANTVATFSMDASLNYWNNDGTLSNTATLGNVPDVLNGGFKTLTSNTTNTEITASPIITIPDTILVNASNDTVHLEATLSTFADVIWTTEGDGQFTEENEQNTMYVLGAQDILDGQVSLFISAESDCNEAGASVLILFAGCEENEDLEIELNAEDLSCEINQVEIMVTSNHDIDSISWSGPSNDGLNGNNLLVSLPGEYILIGYSEDCPDTVSIDIEEALAEAMESYAICEGESIEINNEVYNTAGNYQQILSSSTDCDTILSIELEVLENTMSEETYIIHSGEILDINGIAYDSEGQYMQTLVASNGCDSILIINILEDESLISFDFDDCLATIQTMDNADYSEFIPFYHSQLDCGSVTSSNIYRVDPFENKHSCTEGLNDSYSMCISSDSSCEFDENSTKMVRLDLAINPDPNSEIVISGIEFFQQGPEMFSWINGDDGLNNYPTKFGLRILSDGVEVYSSEDNPTALTWQKEEFTFLNNDNFVFTESTMLEIQMLSYCPVGADSPVTAWDLEDLRIFGSCSSEEGGLKVIAGTVLPYANEVLSDVQILIDNELETKQILIDEHGDYINMENLANSNVNITAYKNDDHLKGVSTLDLLAIQRHLLGLDNFENPLQYIAADLNYDGKISVSDLFELRKLILGIYTELPSNYSYRFLSKKEVQKESTNAWEISENIEIPNLNDHILDADFVPVKIGDVNNQYAEYSMGMTKSHNEISESLYIAKEPSSKDPHYSLIFNLSQSMAVNGLHFSIDINRLSFIGLETQLNNFTEDNFNVTDEGILHISWTDAMNNDDNSTHLFTLKFKENNQGELLNEIVKSEVYAKDKIYKLEPNFQTTEKNEESISNLLVYPNPVNTETIISFDHKKATNVTLSVQNLEGKLVYEEIINSSKGSNKIQIPQSVLQHNAGIYIIRLTDQHTSLLEKIIVTN